MTPWTVVSTDTLKTKRRSRKRKPCLIQHRLSPTATFSATLFLDASPLRGDPSRLPAGTAGRVAGLDIFRGLAMINIVMIHTVFWWGERYAPAWSRNLALLVDVPLFFLSGWAAILQT